MQIHELTRKRQLNEVDLAGPNGLLAGAKAALGALKQPGGVAAAVPGLTSTTNQATGDFAKRMQAIKNVAATKQVAKNIQAQWDQYRTQVSQKTPLSAQQAAQQKQLKSQLLAKRVAGIPPAAPLPLPESRQLFEAAGLIQLTDWYKATVIPKIYAGMSAEYLKNPDIQRILKNIAAAETQGDPVRQKIQGAEFLNLVAATSAVSQSIASKAPAVAGAAATTVRPVAPKASSVQAAQTNVSKIASVTPPQLAQIEKIMGNLPAVTSRDPTTINYLKALGFNVS